MKKLRICIIILVCVLLVGVILYHLPQRRQVSMPVCSATGETAQLEIDVKYYRRLFSMPWVKGTVTFNGDTYRDIATHFGRQHDGSSFWDWVWYFGDPDSIMPANMYFVKEEHDPSKTFQDQIWLADVGNENTFEAIVCFYIQLDNSPDAKLYGPASTIEEARQLSEDQGWYFD